MTPKLDVIDIAPAKKPFAALTTMRTRSEPKTPKPWNRPRSALSPIVFRWPPSTTTASLPAPPTARVSSRLWLAPVRTTPRPKPLIAPLRTVTRSNPPVLSMPIPPPPPARTIPTIRCPPRSTVTPSAPTSSPESPKGQTRSLWSRMSRVTTWPHCPAWPEAASAVRPSRASATTMAPASRFREATPTGGPDGRLRMVHMANSSGRTESTPGGGAAGVGELPAGPRRASALAAEVRSPCRSSVAARARSRRSVGGRGPAAPRGVGAPGT